jgi:hypothetical protein
MTRLCFLGKISIILIVTCICFFFDWRRTSNVIHYGGGFPEE